MTIILALASSAMWGTADFLAGIATKKIKVALVVFISQLFGLLSVTAYGLVTGWEWNQQALLWSFIASVSGFTGLMAFYQALATGPMGIISPIASLGVIFPIVTGLVAGENPSGLQLFGIAVAVIGIVLASGPEITGNAARKPVLLACLAAVGFGVALWAIAKGSQHSVVTTMVAMRGQTITFALIYVVLTKSFQRISFSSVGRLSVIGVFDVMANVLFGQATTLGLLSLTSVLGSLYPVVTVVLAWTILRERLLGIQYVGVVAALIGVAAIAGG